jgi:hypothetical protein
LYFNLKNFGMIKKIFVLLLVSTVNTFIYAQQINDNGDLSTGQHLDEEYNVITTAVPFMTITPDSRGGGMGDVGVATKTDVWSQYWNASKYALAEKDLSIGISYTPWLEALGINDIDLIYLAGYKKIDDEQAFGFGLRYFSMGDIPAFDDDGNKMGYDLTPKEYAFDFSYSRFLSDYFVMGISGRYIYSNLGGEIDPEYKPGKAVASDISGLFFNEISLGGKPTDLSIGFNVSNIGSKITYSSNQKDFIPTNLRIGGGVDIEIDKFNSIAFYLDLNKLLVPTPPMYETDTNALGQEIRVMTGNSRDPNVSVPTGIFQSFYDAPGGFKEELKEYIINTGVEYWYNEQFSLRGGYFHESATKGNRKYFTLGFGLRLNVFGLDFAYLIPTAGTNSPLANTFRFSITFDFAEASQGATKY